MIAQGVLGRTRGSLFPQPQTHFSKWSLACPSFSLGLQEREPGWLGLVFQTPGSQDPVPCPSEFRDPWLCGLSDWFPLGLPLSPCALASGPLESLSLVFGSVFLSLSTATLCSGHSVLSEVRCTECLPFPHSLRVGRTRGGTLSALLRAGTFGIVSAPTLALPCRGAYDCTLHPAHLLPGSQQLLP